MSMGGGQILWAAMTAALAIAFLVSMKRGDQMKNAQLVKIALIWVVIIGGAYFLVSWVTGMT